MEGLPTGLSWNSGLKHITGAVTDPLLVGPEHLITVTATDPYGAQGTAYVTVSITGVDDPLELVEALPDQQGFRTDFDLQAYYNDPDGDPISFTFSLEGDLHARRNVRGPSALLELDRDSRNVRQCHHSRRGLQHVVHADGLFCLSPCGNCAGRT